MERVQLAGPLRELPERWWYLPHVNDAEKHQCAVYEPKKHMQACPKSAPLGHAVTTAS